MKPLLSLHLTLFLLYAAVLVSTTSAANEPVPTDAYNALYEHYDFLRAGNCLVCTSMCRMLQSRAEVNSLRSTLLQLRPDLLQTFVYMLTELVRALDYP